MIKLDENGVKEIIDLLTSSTNPYIVCSVVRSPGDDKYEKRMIFYDLGSDPIRSFYFLEESDYLC